MAAIELIEDRDADYDVADKAAAFITGTADLSWNRGCVLGSEITDWRHIDLSAAQGEMLINGQVVGTGYGRDVLGHPLDSLAWVANHLINRGRSLRANDIVMTGSVVRTHWLRQGDQVITRFDAFGDAVLNVV